MRSKVFISLFTYLLFLLVHFFLFLSLTLSLFLRLSLCNFSSFFFIFLSVSISYSPPSLPLPSLSFPVSVCLSSPFLPTLPFQRKGTSPVRHSFLVVHYLLHRASPLISLSPRVRRVRPGTLRKLALTAPPPPPPPREWAK